MAEKFPKKEEKKIAEGVKEIGHVQEKEIGHDEPVEISEEKKVEIESAKKAEIEMEKKPGLPEESGKELEQDLIRLQAEFENYRKRTQKEMNERKELGKMELAKSLLGVVDEFENALKHLDGEGKAGMEMVLANMRKVLEKEGVREMKCDGQMYDPYKHEVIAQQESEKESGVVLQVARKGYLFGDKVLRHAQVIVAKRDAEDDREQHVLVAKLLKEAEWFIEKADMPHAENRVELAKNAANQIKNETRRKHAFENLEETRKHMEKKKADITKSA
ncbi:MAG: nucleotide exchange factor GrpE [Candidatus ainarchaeum sp.]|nr:nucleotide exchange factor GrpE [Candidatus ainarchaeum sp.]